MAISLKHLFTSAKADGPDSTLIQPSNWNAEHVLTMATARLLGRTTAATGATEEISVGTGLTLSAGSLSVTTSTYQPLDADLTAIAALVSAADRLPYFTGSGTAALATFTAAGRTLVAGVDAAAQRTSLALGTAATLNVGTAANNVVQLNGSAQLPAVDGSLLTGVSGTGRLLRAPQILTSGTSYTTPAGCNSVYVEAVGAGGGGGGAGDPGPDVGDTNAGAGGGSGGYAAKFFTVSPSTAYAYAIGAGGTSSSGGSGTNGGNTTFTVSAVTITAGGGVGGLRQLGSSVPIAGTGGTATNGDLNVVGNSGIAGGRMSLGTAGAAKISGGSGGGSFFGGSGRGAADDASVTNGDNGTSGGGGGGGVSTDTATSSAAGGSGGAGLIRITEYT